MTDDQHPPEPFVPTPANDPAVGPRPGEGSDDKRNDDLDTFGVPPAEPATQPDYFPQDASVSDSDVPPTEPHEERE